MGNGFFDGKIGNFAFNTDLTLYKLNPQKKEQPVSDIFQLSKEGSNSYASDALQHAKDYIAMGDTNNDGVLTKDEYIAMQKKHLEELNKKTGGQVADFHWDNELHPELHGNVFDAINIKRNPEGSKTPEAIDEKEMAAFLAEADSADNNDGQKDGKIKFGTISMLEEFGADNFDEEAVKRRNKLINNFQSQYKEMFGKDK